MPKNLSSPTVRFYLHKVAGRESNRCPINAIMRNANVCYKVATGEGVLASHWNKKRQRVEISKIKEPLDRPEFNRLNDRLDEWVRLLREIWDTYHSQPQRRPLTNAYFNELVRIRRGEAVVKETPTLLEFAAQYVADKEKEKGERHPTVNNLRYGLKNLAAYSDKFGVVDYEHINFDWLERFKPWLFQQVEYKNFKRRALNQNSAAQVVSAIKQILSEARKKEYTTNIIVKERGFAVKKSETNKAAFYLDELDAIYKADLSQHPQRKEMERVRILTILACSTGLRHSDWVKVKKELVHEEEGELLLNVFAKKTKAKIGIPFTPMLRTVLDENDWQIPKMAVQRYNEGIKALCKYAGISRSVLVMESIGGKPTSKQVPFYEVVSSHACRRTFISTMLLLGVPASQILPITGHQTEKQMRDYAQIEGRQNAASISKTFRKGMEGFLGIGKK